MIGAAEPIPISALEHYEYCARQCALIHVDGLWVENEHTVRGQRGHRRADRPGQRVERGRRVIRGLSLWSEALGLTGRADTVEVSSEGAVKPVEYKIGSRHGLTADVQVCAQALCLEEMFRRPIPTAAIWYSGPRRRHIVELTTDLRALTVDRIQQVHALRAQSTLPPAVNDQRCAHCQFAAMCLPSIVDDSAAIERYLVEEVFACE